ncbi:hypothetical protein MKEN_01305700 [Mycena kentingensis (nom. inval.)]|nr:hypothetical protein MKEN_01305700 [Mycena kentingensis (nom. inval.)]
MSIPNIILYDIPSAHPRVAWSPNTFKSRYVLNFKGLAYTTKWVEYPDIEPLCKEIGGAPTRNKPDGRPHYTLPMIHDLNTGIVVTDSLNIAMYLDKTYPSTPQLLPPSAWPLFRAFDDAMQPLLAPVYPFALPLSQRILNPPSGAYFRETREKTLGQMLDALLDGAERDPAQWAQVKASFATIEGWMKTSLADDAANARFFGGAHPSYADLYIAAYLLWLKTVLPAERWRDVESWNGGRWAELLATLAKYETVV